MSKTNVINMQIKELVACLDPKAPANALPDTLFLCRQRGVTACTLYANGKRYTGSGTTVAEAFENLRPSKG